MVKMGFGLFSNNLSMLSTSTTFHSNQLVMLLFFSRSEPAEHHPDSDRDHPDRLPASPRPSTKPTSSCSGSCTKPWS